MGFFDNLKAICDTRRWYTEDRLYQYFAYEIYGRTNPDGFKDKVTTNIRELINGLVKNNYPDVNNNKTKLEITDGKIEKLSDTMYKMKYVGIIRVYNSFDDYRGKLYYTVVVFADKYADLSSDPNQKAKIVVSPNPIN